MWSSRAPMTPPMMPHTATEYTSSAEMPCRGAYLAVSHMATPTAMTLNSPCQLRMMPPVQ